MTIHAAALSKDFDERRVVDRLTFDVRGGEVYGLIGPNGAGKTTTMRMLVGLLRPSSGKAHVAGADVVREPLRARAQVGFVSGTTGLYERLTARELLVYSGRLYGLSQRRALERAAELAATLHFEHLLDRRSGGLSTGERQRVALARASLHDPPVLIFDEPTAGLDVVASRFVAEHIRDCRARGRAVLFSTHYMTEAELLCDRIGLLDGGHLLAEGTPAELKASFAVDTLEEIFLAIHGQSLRASAANASALPDEFEP